MLPTLQIPPTIQILAKLSAAAFSALDLSAAAFSAAAFSALALSFAA